LRRQSPRPEASMGHAYARLTVHARLVLVQRVATGRPVPPAPRPRSTTTPGRPTPKSCPTGKARPAPGSCCARPTGSPPRSVPATKRSNPTVPGRTAKSSGGLGKALGTIFCRRGVLGGVCVGGAAAAATTAIFFVDDCGGRRSLAPCCLGWVERGVSRVVPFVGPPAVRWMGVWGGWHG
jgi:hypothetical protein